MFGQGNGTAQHPNNSEMTISMKNLKKTRSKTCLSVTSSQVTLNLTPAVKPVCNDLSCTCCIRVRLLIIMPFLVLQSLLNLRLVQNCLPLFSVLQVVSPVPYAHILQIFLNWPKPPQFRVSYTSIAFWLRESGIRRVCRHHSQLQLIRAKSVPTAVCLLSLLVAWCQRAVRHVRWD
jgi:hypothetical protein